MFLDGHSLGSKNSNNCCSLKNFGKKSLWREHFLYLPQTRDYFLYLLYSYYCRRKSQPSHQLHQHFTEILPLRILEDRVERGSCAHSLPVIKNCFSSDLNNKRGRKIILFSWVSSKSHLQHSPNRPFQGKGRNVVISLQGFHTVVSYHKSFIPSWRFSWAAPQSTDPFLLHKAAN